MSCARRKKRARMGRGCIDAVHRHHRARARAAVRVHRRRHHAPGACAGRTCGGDRGRDRAAHGREHIPAPLAGGPAARNNPRGAGGKHGRCSDLAATSPHRAARSATHGRVCAPRPAEGGVSQARLQALEMPVTSPTMLQKLHFLEGLLARRYREYGRWFDITMTPQRADYENSMLEEITADYVAAVDIQEEVKGKREEANEESTRKGDQTDRLGPPAAMAPGRKDTGS